MFAQASPALIKPVRVAPAQARSWARLIARIYEIDPLRCRHCGGAMQLIAFIVESAVIVRLLDHLREPSRALGMASIRGPPRADDYWARLSIATTSFTIQHAKPCPTTRASGKI